MTLRELFGRLATWRRRDAMAHELTSEVEAHVALLARDLEREGMSPADALAAARRRIGDVGRLREESRDAWGFPAIDAIVQDVRYALRGLRRAPGFTITVILTLGLGIGANVAIFAVLDRLMFRPFPLLHDPATVGRVYLRTTYRGRSNANSTFPYLRFVDLSAATRTISDIAAQTEWRFAVGTGEAAAVRKIAGVTPSFFRFFDAPPSLGRYFVASEDSTATPVAVLSHRFWATELGSANVIGRRLMIGVVDYTIIGVAPPDFVGTVAGGPPDIFVPLTTIPANLGSWSVESYRRDYSWDWVQVLVRRRPGATRQDASAELTTAYIRSRAAARALNPRVLADSLAHPLAIVGAVKTSAGPDGGAEGRAALGRGCRRDRTAHRLRERGEFDDRASRAPAARDHGALGIGRSPRPVARPVSHRGHGARGVRRGGRRGVRANRRCRDSVDVAAVRVVVQSRHGLADARRRLALCDRRGVAHRAWSGLVGVSARSRVVTAFSQS